MPSNAARAAALPRGTIIRSRHTREPAASVPPPPAPPLASVIVDLAAPAVPWPEADDDFSDFAEVDRTVVAPPSYAGSAIGRLAPPSQPARPAPAATHAPLAGGSAAMRPAPATAQAPLAAGAAALRSAPAATPAPLATGSAAMRPAPAAAMPRPPIAARMAALPRPPIAARMHAMPRPPMPPAPTAARPVPMPHAPTAARPAPMPHAPSAVHPAPVPRAIAAPFAPMPHAPIAVHPAPIPIDAPPSAAIATAVAGARFAPPSATLGTPAPRHRPRASLPPPFPARLVRGERGNSMLVALIVMSSLAALGSLTVVSVQSSVRVSSQGQFSTTARYAAESGAAVAMDWLRGHIDHGGGGDGGDGDGHDGDGGGGGGGGGGGSGWSSVLSPSNTSPVLVPFPSNGALPGTANNPFTLEQRAWYEVTLLNNRSDPGFASGQDTDARVIVRAIGHGPQGAVAIIDWEVRATGGTTALELLGWHAVF